MAYLFKNNSIEKNTVKAFLKSFLKYHRENFISNDETFLDKFLDDYGLTPVILFADNGGINQSVVKCIS